MVYNVWNDPEREIVEAAIVRFVDDISDEDIDALFDASSKQYPEDIDEYNDVYSLLCRELKQKYLVDIELDENLSYFQQKLTERVREQHGLNLGEGVR